MASAFIAAALLFFHFQLLAPPSAMQPVQVSLASTVGEFVITHRCHRDPVDLWCFLHLRWPGSTIAGPEWPAAVHYRALFPADNRKYCCTMNIRNRMLLLRGLWLGC